MDIRTKIEVDDIDGYDWNWSAKYLDEYVKELSQAFSASFIAEVPNAPQALVQRIASAWASKEAAESIVKIMDTTRERVRIIISGGLREGQSIQSMAKGIRDDFVFSKQRATVVARTETAIALGEGSKDAAIHQGRDEKRWITSGDDLVSDDCRMNETESEKWIPIADPFASGVSTIPQHPNCRCNVRYRTSELHSPDMGTIIGAVENNVRGDFRCPGCNRLLARNAAEGIRIHCRHCKAERVA